MELVTPFMNSNLHYISPMGRKPAGLGNEIIGLSKAILGIQIFGGKLIAPDYSTSNHEYPKVILENFEFKRYNLPLKRMIRVGSEVFDQLGTEDNLWNYKSILEQFAIRECLDNSKRFRVLHASKMTGGYLAIRESRAKLLELFEIDLSDSSSLERSVSLHLRGSDISNLDSSRMLQKEIEDYFKPALLDLSNSGCNLTKLNLISNLNSNNPQLLDVVHFAKSLGFLCNYSDADPLTHLKLLTKTSFIIPSVSTFSLLGIFLSNAKYFWPSKYTSLCGNWYSIWGSERLQILGPTKWFREINMNPGYNSLDSRGLIHGSFNQFFLQEWVKHKTEHKLSQDLIYYGSTKFEKEIYKM